MDRKTAEQFQSELLLMLISTLLMIAIYWWFALPEWKKEAIQMDLKKRMQIRVVDGLSLTDRLTLEQFRREISRWEHARKRDNTMGTRDTPQESD